MTTLHRPNRLLALLLAAVIGAAPALAAPPWAGGGKGGGEEREHGGGKEHKGGGHGGGKEHKAHGGQDHKGGGRASEDRAPRKPQQGAYFSDRNRDAVRTYYASAGKGGKGCPPGLAKKNNGCLPPGQAKKWNVGQPLPSDVKWYPVPQQIVVALPPVPVGHKYVQVAGDILLVAVGSMMVVDGINGLLSR